MFGQNPVASRMPPCYHIPVQRGRPIWLVIQRGVLTMSDPVVYRSNVRIERVRGPLRRAYVPQETEPIFFGVHYRPYSSTEVEATC